MITKELVDRIVMGGGGGYSTVHLDGIEVFASGSQRECDMFRAELLARMAAACTGCLERELDDWKFKYESAEANMVPAMDWLEQREKVGRLEREMKDLTEQRDQWREKFEHAQAKVRLARMMYER